MDDCTCEAPCRIAAKALARPGEVAKEPSSARADGIFTLYDAAL